MFTRNLGFAFLAMSIFFSFYLAYSFYDAYTFEKSPIPKHVQKAIDRKEREILRLMQENYGFVYKFPLIVTDKIPSKLYGLTSLDEKGEIKIFLNKKVMKESLPYILESVIAHEYAHALLFELNKFAPNHEGHSRLWQQTCIKLGGEKCAQYVDINDVVIGKLPF